MDKPLFNNNFCSKCEFLHKPIKFSPVLNNKIISFQTRIISTNTTINEKHQLEFNEKIETQIPTNTYSKN